VQLPDPLANHPRVRHVLFLGLTYLLQAGGLVLFGFAKAGGSRDAFTTLVISGTLAMALGWTIRRTEGQETLPLAFALLATAGLGVVRGPVVGGLCLALSAVPLACIYHGEMIGEHFLSIAPYSGARTTPVHGGCVRVVGFLLLVGAVVVCATAKV
jgi:hypothetical protein